MSQSPQRAHNVVVLSQPAAAPSAALAALAENRTVGARLAAARLAKGLSLDEVRAGTKVKIFHLEAIEAGDRESLPATPFAAGFVKAYAQFLALDPDGYARAFRAETDPAPADAPSGPTAAPAATAAAGPGPEKLVAYIGIGAILVAVLWITVLAIAPHKEYAAPVDSMAPAAQAVPVAPPLDVTASQTPATVAIAEAPPPAAAASATIAETQYTDIETAVPASPTPVAETAPAPPQEATPTPRLKTPPAPETQPIAADESPAVEPQAAEITPPPAMPSVAEETAPQPIEDAAAAPVSKDPVIVVAEVTRSPAAKYPDQCARGAADIENIRIALDVTAEGRPGNARIVETSNDCFDGAALAAARRMRFSPRLVDGAPSAETGKIVTVRFSQ